MGLLDWLFKRRPTDTEMWVTGAAHARHLEAKEEEVRAIHEEAVERVRMETEMWSLIAAALQRAEEGETAIFYPERGTPTTKLNREDTQRLG